MKRKKNKKKIKKKNKAKFKIKKRKIKKTSKKKIGVKRKLKKKNKKIKSSKSKSKELARKIVRLINNLKPKFKIKINIDKSLQRFFQKISDNINSFKQVIEEERQKEKLKKLKLMQKEKSENLRLAKLAKKEEIKKKQEEVRLEIKLEKERKFDIKRFIREEQANLRKEQAEKRRKFLEKIKLEKKIDQFRKREALEIKNLEKFVLKQERQNYEEVQARIENIRHKYQAIRDQKIRERIEQLGISVSDTDSREQLLEKERQFNISREKIEYVLESFYRSMTSCVFQLNKRWLPKKMSLLRVVDQRYETSEIFIKLDEELDENWVLLVYLKDNNPDSRIVVEDKTNPDKKNSLEFKSNEIFRFSDILVDSLTNMIDRNFKKIN